LQRGCCGAVARSAQSARAEKLRALLLPCGEPPQRTT
jgi:hypothetical protein